MLFHSAQDPRLTETVFRAIEHSTPASVSAAVIEVGLPVLLETHTASQGGNFVRRPAPIAGFVEEADVTNNLFVGVVAHRPLQPGAIGLAQVYGPVLALVLREGGPFPPGVLLQPSAVGFLGRFATGATKPSPGLGGMAVLLDAVSAGPATEAVLARVFVRCM